MDDQTQPDDMACPQCGRVRHAAAEQGSTDDATTWQWTCTQCGCEVTFYQWNATSEE